MTQEPQIGAHNVAEIEVDQPRLLKTMRWWDGFVIGAREPGVPARGLAGSVETLGPKWAADHLVLFCRRRRAPGVHLRRAGGDVPGQVRGLSMYAKEGWRKHFSLAGPIATFGYWFAWSSVLAIYGGIIGTLPDARFWYDRSPTR